MDKKLFLLGLIVLLVAFSIAACAPADEPPAGDPPIDTPPGETPNQEQPPATENGGQTADMEASEIPHALDGLYENCMQCHSEIKASHEAYGNYENCTDCHKPAG